VAKRGSAGKGRRHEGVPSRNGCHAEMVTKHAGNSQPTKNLSDALPIVVDTLPSSSRRRRFAQLRAGSPQIVPSLLMCDFGHLADEVKRLVDAGAEVLHLDVMDGHFVPNISYGLPIVAAVRKATDLPIEAHLMISEPARYARDFADAGADALTFHIEALPDPRSLLETLRGWDIVAGLALNPGTPLSAIEPYLDACDLVLAMSVQPGFGGQAFDPVALEKLNQLRTRVGSEVLLEVDGGVNAHTIAQCAAAGSQLHVVGSAIFSQPNYSQSMADLRRLALSHARTH